MAHDYPHRRRFPRISSEHTVLVKKLGGDAAEAFAKTRVVGLGGCMFVSSGPVGVGSIVEVLISVHLRVVRALVRVVYEIAKGDTEFEVGVEFVEISPADRQIIEAMLKGATAT
jgi:hypothetical protein